MAVGAALIVSAGITATANFITGLFGNKAARDNFDKGLAQDAREYEFEKSTFIQDQEQKRFFQQGAQRLWADLLGGTVEKGAPKREPLQMARAEAWENPARYQSDRSWIGDAPQVSTRQPDVQGFTPSVATPSPARSMAYAELLSSPGSLPPEATPRVAPEVTAKQFFQPEPPRDYGLAAPATTQAIQPLSGLNWSVAPSGPQVTRNYFDPLDPSYSWRL